MEKNSTDEHSYASFDDLHQCSQHPSKEKKAIFEHSYAYSNLVRAFVGKERDHCYTFKGMDLAKIPKQGVQKEHSYSSYRDRESDLSDDDVSDTVEQSLFSRDPYYQLPHYQSSDSALDVTCSDSISDKCLSTENLNLRTVEVFTDCCIMHGNSDPDISKMSLQSIRPNSLNKERTSFLCYEHNYSLRKKPSSHYFNKSEIDRMHTGFIWSPLQDHSYDLSEKNKQSKDHSFRNFPISFRESPNLDHTYQYFPKSPFLDHTYQTIRKKRNDDLPVLCHSDTHIPESDQDLLSVYTVKTKCNKNTDIMKSVLDASIVKRANMDHAYGKRSDGSGSEIRIRSNSLSDFRLCGNDFLSDDRMDDDSSDSGTESLNGLEESPMLTDSSDQYQIRP